MDPWLPHPLEDALVKLIAQHFRVLGEPMRIRLLDVLRGGEATVQELQAATGASQQNISKHLGVMLGAGLVTRAKVGNYSRYALADGAGEAVFALCGQVCGRLRQQLDEQGALLGRVTPPSGPARPRQADSGRAEQPIERSG